MEQLKKLKTRSFGMKNDIYEMLTKLAESNHATRSEMLRRLIIEAYTKTEEQK